MHNSVAMGLTVKLLPLFGVVVLCGVVFATNRNFDDINTLPAEEKRRIIRELLRAQRDIRSALLKVHYSLNGEEFDADGKEDPYWQGCWDKELAGYRKSIETKMSAMSSGLKQAHHLVDEINERVKPHWYGPHKPGYGWHGSYGGDYGPPGYGPGPEYGQPGYGPGPEHGPDYEDGYKPSKPSHPETTSWRPTTESYAPGGDNDDDYYARNRPVGGSRRYGRELDVSKQEDVETPQPQADTVVDKAVDPIEESTVIDALEQLAEDSQ
uniref:Uncharacterized protein n=1 Tax=Anopheles culicifacies TaxID=139723 RepID=A0A182MDF3_9DIPT